MTTRILTILALVGSLATADVTGTWSATAETRFPSGRVETHAMTFIFKQDGTTLTGSLGQDATHQLPISNGKVGSDSLTFDCKWGNGALLHFALSARGDEMKGEGHGDESQLPKNPGPDFTNVFYLTLKRVTAP